MNEEIIKPKSTLAPEALERRVRELEIVIKRLSALSEKSNVPMDSVFSSAKTGQALEYWLEALLKRQYSKIFEQMQGGEPVIWGENKAPAGKNTLRFSQAQILSDLAAAIAKISKRNL